MDPKVIVGTGLGLRIFAFICLLIALVVIATDKLALIDGTKKTYNDVHGYRYVLGIAVIGLAHTIFQLGFSTYHLLSKNIPIWNGFPQFNYYADQVISWVLASAAGAGFAVTAELKKAADKMFEDVGDEALSIPEVDEQKSIIDDYFGKGNIASAILFLAFVSTAIIVLISPFNRTKAVEAKTASTQDVEAQEAEAQVTEAQAAEGPSSSK